MLRQMGVLMLRRMCVLMLRRTGVVMLRQMGVVMLRQISDLMLRSLPKAGVSKHRVRVSYSAATSLRLPSSSTSRPVSRARSMTPGCQETLPASGPPTMASIIASGSPDMQRKPR